MTERATASPASSNGRHAGWGTRLNARAQAWVEALRRKTPTGGPQVITDVMRGDHTQRYLDPQVLARFPLSPLLARKLVEGFIHGLHASPFHGFSVEFADHRDYVPGDDLRYLDWALFARTDHYYIRRYQEETNLRCHILMDRSASMAFGTGTITKWDYACFLASCLAYLVLHQQDAVGLGLFGDKPGVLMPPRCRTTQLRQLMRVMINHPPSGATDVAASLHAMVRRLKRRGMVVVISDLIDEPEATVKALRLLAGHKHDVVVFHIQDAAELEFDFAGPTLFRDLETGEELEVDPAGIRDSYRQHVASLGDYYRKQLQDAGVDYHPINTRQPYEQALTAYLARRTRTQR